MASIAPIRRTLKEEYTLRDTVRFFRRQRWVFVLCLLAALGIWGIVLAFAPKVYRASVAVTLEGALQNTPIGPDPLDQVRLTVRGEDVPSLADRLQGNEVLSRAFSLANVRFAPPGSDQPAPKIDIERAGFTRTVVVNVDWSNPDEALRVAQNIPVAFTEAVRQERLNQANQALEFLDQRAEEERKRLDAAEQKLFDFDGQRPLVATGDQTGVLAERATTAEFRRQQAESDLEAARNRLASLEAARATLERRLNLPTRQTNRERIEQEQALLNQMVAERQALLSRFLEDHPEVKALDARIARQRQTIRELPREIDVRQEIRNPQIDAYADRVAEARAALQAAQAASSKATEEARRAQEEVQQYNTLLPQRSALIREIELARAALDRIAQTREDLRLRRETTEDPARVISPAFVRERPISPRPIPFLIIAVAAGLAVALALSFVREQVDDRIVSPDEAYDVLGEVPTLGILPARTGDSSALLAKVDDPDVAASGRFVKFNVAAFLAQNPQATVLVTSPRRRSGKTWLSATLASRFAQERSVLLVDLGTKSPVAGFTDWLSGKAVLSQVVKGGTSPNLSLLGRGQSAFPENLNGPALQAKLAELYSQAELVVLDGGAALEDADTLLLAGHVNAVVLAVRLDRTRRADLMQAANRIALAGGNLAGLVFVESGQRGR